MPHIPASAALSHLRVIDLTQVRAGPTCCRQLADWGADVVQVQMPEHMRGDDTLGGQEGSDYQYTHRNKRSITLNLKEPEGIALLKRLIAQADVLVENFRPDVKFRLGIDYETLAKDHPKLVYASISGFGSSSALAGAYGIIDSHNVRRNVRVVDRQYRRLDKCEHFVNLKTGDLVQIPSAWERNRIAHYLEASGGDVTVTKKLIKRIRWTVTADGHDVRVTREGGAAGFGRAAAAACS